MLAIDTRLLKSFLIVAEELNVTRAAARLHLTQQAVSTHVRQLERSLQAALLVRVARGVILTAAGEELAAGGAKVTRDLTELAERVRAVARAEQGVVRLACCPYATHLFAAEVADALETAFPGLEVQLTSVPSPKRELAMLLEGRADAAFMWLPVGGAGLQHAVVRTDPRIVLLANGHRLADHSALTLADLADELVLRPEGHSGADAERHWLADPRPDGTSAPRGAVVAGMEDCLLGVARGRGIWMAPEPLTHLAPLGNLRSIPVRDGGGFELAVVWADHAPRPAIARMTAEVRAMTGYRPDGAA